MDVFGKLNPKIMDDYQKEYIDKQKAKAEDVNYTAWLQGLYIRDAVQNALHGRKAKYPDKPYNKEETEDGESIDVYEKFRRKMRAMNERMKESDSKAPE